MKKEVVLDCGLCGSVYELPRGLSVETLRVGQPLTCMNCLATVMVCQHDHRGIAIRGLTPDEWERLKNSAPTHHTLLMAAAQKKYGCVPENDGVKEVGLIVPHKETEHGKVAD